MPNEGVNGKTLRSGKTISEGNTDSIDTEDVAGVSVGNREVGSVESPMQAQNESSALTESMQVLMSRFERMFVQHQMEVNRATTEAVQSAIKGLRKDVETIGVRLSDLEIKSANKSNNQEDSTEEQEENRPRRRLFEETLGFTPVQVVNSALEGYDNRRNKRVRDWGLKF